MEVGLDNNELKLNGVKNKMAKLQPKGFIAICQCGLIVGAMDYQNTERKDAGKILGQWIAEGCTIQPKFEGCWQVTVTSCKCDNS